MNTPQQFNTISIGEVRLPAVAVSRGVGTGKLVFLSDEKRKHFRRDIDAGQIESEVARFRSALNLAVNDLKRLSKESAGNNRATASDMFDVQAIILESSILEKVVTTIRSEKVDAEWAIRTVADVFIERQLSVADSRFREKSIDIEDAIERLFAAIQTTNYGSQIEPGSVIATGDLRPSVLLEISKFRPAAIIIEHGGWTSHVSILARELKFPMVSGIKNLSKAAEEGDIVLVDGVIGEIVIHPLTKSIELATRSFDSNQTQQIVAPEASKGAITRDDVQITLRVNTDTASSYEYAHEIGAEGIGLFRSESILKRSGTFPSEEEQYIIYREIADSAGVYGVKIRTFDIGAVHDDDRRSAERNPALGLRAIRYGLTNLEVFRTQIRSILRASADRNIDIILPMVSGVEDVLTAKTLIAQEAELLSQAGLLLGTPRLGAMIETPSAVITARGIANHVELFCIGTNDLVQYLLAVDRDNESVADWYQSLHPAVLWSIREVVKISQAAQIPVSVCGEMAGSPFYVPVLLGLGVREFSMNVTSIEPVLHLIGGISISKCIELASFLDNFETADEIQSELTTYYRSYYSELFPPGLLDIRHR